MKSLASALLIGLSIYVSLGGQLRKVKISKINLPNFTRSNSKQQDQEFLGYLWSLKSDLSAGAIPSNLEVGLPKHFLSKRLKLVLELSSKTGTPITPLLNRFIRQVKNQIELKQEIASELASTKATVLVLATLPLLGVLLSTVIGTNSLRWLISTPVGRVSLFIGLLLNLIGGLWVNRIVKKALIV